MKKLLLICICALGFSTTTYAQQESPCDFFEETTIEDPAAYFDDLKNALQINLPDLKTTRQWARKQKRPEVELATNRLEYWAKKMIQAIDKNNPENIELLCEKFQKEREYISDFIQLTIMFKLTNGIYVNKVDYSKYN